MGYYLPEMMSARRNTLSVKNGGPRLENSVVHMLQDGLAGHVSKNISVLSKTEAKFIESR